LLRRAFRFIFAEDGPAKWLRLMHIIIWEFVVREEHIQQFISAYNSNGDWANLFRRAEGFLGTELLRSSHQPNIFVTVDRWESASRFEMFQQRFGAEYKKLDITFEGYTSSEKQLGVFAEV
jgi:heme-degrading monooxygenase HmoA